VGRGAERTADRGDPAATVAATDDDLRDDQHRAGGAGEREAAEGDQAGARELQLVADDGRGDDLGPPVVGVLEAGWTLGSEDRGPTPTDDPVAAVDPGQRLRGVGQQAQ